VSLGRGRRLLLGVAALLLPLLAWPGTTLAAVRASEADSIRQSQTVEVDIAGDVITGRPAEVTVRATNPSSEANQGSLTVSLPGNPNVEILGASAVVGSPWVEPGGLGWAALAWPWAGWPSAV